MWRIFNISRVVWSCYFLINPGWDDYSIKLYLTTMVHFQLHKFEDHPHLMSYSVGYCTSKKRRKCSWRAVCVSFARNTPCTWNPPTCQHSSPTMSGPWFCKSPGVRNGDHENFRCPKKLLVYNGKSQSKMDDDWGYWTWGKQPDPFAVLNVARWVCLCFFRMGARAVNPMPQTSIVNL